MRIIDSQDYTRKKLVDRRIRFCVECGSTRIEVYGKYLACSECKAIRHFKVKPVRFQPGDFVRIVEKYESSDIVYRIIKIKKSQEGTVSYILKRESSRIEILYYEGDNSHLEKIITTREKSRKKACKV